MRRTQKKVVKKNLFEDEDDFQPQDKQEQEAKHNNQQEIPGSKKIIGKVDERYDAHQIKQNQHYLGKKKAQNDLQQQLKSKQKEESSTKTRSAKFSKKKKKNLFDSDEEEQAKIQQDKLSSGLENSEFRQSGMKQLLKNEQIEEEEEIKSNNSVEKSNGSEKQQRSDEDYIDEDQDQKREQHLNEILKSSESKIQESKKMKEVSFSRLIQKYEQDRDELKRIIYEPIPNGFRASCIFKRVPNGMSETYQLIMEDDEKSIMFCENQRGSIGANYYISLTKQMDKNSASYLGKLRGNSTGSEYQLYDAGKQPQKKINRKQWRCTMGRIEYETNILGMNGPRKLKVMVPTVKQMSEFDSFKLREDESLSALESGLVKKYRNKQPRWNERLKSYALNFGGKVKQASIKNFILVNEQISVQDEVNATNHLVFGKIDENSFSMEAIHPLSIYQAFGIVMSQFDFKLNCQ